jgi:hypothetical protein
MSLISYGQRSSEPRPPGGKTQVLLPFYSINFTDRQRGLLNGTSAELLFEITEDGIPILDNVQGITDVAIIDSIYHVSRQLPRFEPATRNGIPEPSVYLLKLHFGDRDYHNDSPNQMEQQAPESRDDFALLETGSKLDLLIAGAFNIRDGKAADYLYPGGGMKFDIMVIGKKNFGVGLALGLYGNRLKNDYPIIIPYQQSQSQTTVLIGLAFGKILSENRRSQVFAQFEPCYVIQTVVHLDDYYQDESIEFEGFSPAVVLNYMVSLGRERFYHYGSPTIVNNFLNIHAAIRPIWLNERSASGIMLEVGIGWRLRGETIRAYKLKDDF